jgi:hypothetical protein
LTVEKRVWVLPKLIGDEQTENPPTDGGGFRYFYHNWTNSISDAVHKCTYTARADVQ